MVLIVLLRSLSLNRAFSALLTLMVLLHGTLLAPQLVMGPECNAFEGIASSAHRDFTWEKDHRWSAKAVTKQVMADGGKLMFRGIMNGVLWLCMTPFIVAKIAFRALKIPIGWVSNSMNHWCSSEDKCLRGPMVFSDHGVGTPAPDQAVEAAGCKRNAGIKTDELKGCREELSADVANSAQEAVPIEGEIAREAGESNLGNIDCWAAIDTANMKSLDGSLRQMLDTALMMAEVDDGASSSNGSQGGDNEQSIPDFHDALLEEDGTLNPGRPTDVYVPSMDPASPGVIDQLREASADGSLANGVVEIDAAAVKEILGKLRAGEAHVMDLESRYQQLLDEQDVMEEVRSMASNESESQVAAALAKVALVLENSQKSSGVKNGYVLTKSIGELKLDALTEAEHGQMHAWEAWLKATKLKLKQKASGLVELLDTASYTEESAGHSQQLTAAFLRCFEEGTRVWDIAQTAIQEHGERADLVIAAVESEVGRGEMFRAFRYTVEFFEDHWLRHDDPWGKGLAVTLSHLMLLCTRLNKEKLSVDQLMVLRVAALLPERFSWLQREIFKSHEDMTVVKLQEALKPHVKAGVLADSQAYKHKAVGAGATDSGNTRKESKALAAVTRQNREMAKEIEQLKNARPERPSGGKGKGSKGKRNNSGGKGGKGGKGNSNFTVTCAHPQCKGEHFLKECPKMQGLASEEFRRQYKQYINAFFEPGRTEKGFGKAVVELSAYAEMPTLVDDNEA